MSQSFSEYLELGACFTLYKLWDEEKICIKHIKSTLCLCCYLVTISQILFKWMELPSFVMTSSRITRKLILSADLQIDSAPVPMAHQMTLWAHLNSITCAQWPIRKYFQFWEKFARVILVGQTTMFFISLESSFNRVPTGSEKSVKTMLAVKSQRNWAHSKKSVKCLRILTCGEWKWWHGLRESQIWSQSNARCMVLEQTDTDPTAQGQF